MSLLSPESLSVFISPSELVAVHWQGLSPRIVDKRRIPVSAGALKPAEAAAKVFAELLPEFSGCRRIRLVLSSHFAQYQLLPWRADLNDGDEELAVARLAFSETYGEAALGWQVRVGDEAPGLPRLAAAVDGELLNALEQAASAGKARLVSIQPYLSAAANYWASAIKRDQASWLVAHEAGRLSVALANQGRWCWMRSLRVGADWAENLPQLLDDELLLAGIELPPAQALVFSPAIAELAVPSASRWAFRCLRPAASRNFSPMTDSHFAFALVG